VDIEGFSSMQDTTSLPELNLVGQVRITHWSQDLSTNMIHGTFERFFLLSICFLFYFIFHLLLNFFVSLV
jgi:hypothetical protein